MMFEKAPIPPVGKAFVKEIKVIAHMVGSKRPSTVEVRTVSFAVHTCNVLAWCFCVNTFIRARQWVDKDDLTLNSLFCNPVSFFLTRSAIRMRSSGVKHLARMGLSGSQNPTKIPHTNVTQPSN